MAAFDTVLGLSQSDDGFPLAHFAPWRNNDLVIYLTLFFIFISFKFQTVSNIKTPGWIYILESFRTVRMGGGGVIGGWNAFVV